MKYIKGKIKTIRKEKESCCIVTYSYNNKTKTFSNFFRGPKNNIYEMLCYALSLLKEPCYIEMTLSDEKDYNKLKQLVTSPHCQPQIFSSISTTKKLCDLFSFHRIYFILDYTALRNNTISIKKPITFKKEKFWTLGKHYATKRKENYNPYAWAKLEQEKWKKRQSQQNFPNN